MDMAMEELTIHPEMEEERKLQKLLLLTYLKVVLIITLIGTNKMARLENNFVKNIHFINK